VNGIGYNNSRKQAKLF